jgi:hypothetical protein
MDRPGRAPTRSTRRTLVREFVKNRAFRGLVLSLLRRRTFFRRRASRLTIACHPSVPNHKEMIWKVALLMGARLVAASRDSRPADSETVRLYWGRRAGLGHHRPDLPTPAWAQAVNAGTHDTGKRNTARLFEQVFGYALAVDPTVHAGPCVAKSDDSACHDGRIVQCPIDAPEAGVSYEILVANKVDETEVEDLRLPVVGDELPFVYRKRRPIEQRFLNRNLSVRLVALADVFSSAEVANIKRFCRAMRLDLGEIDILRDAGSGRIYIVDVNRMPFGPPRPIQHKDAVRAVILYAEALRRQAIRWRAAEAVRHGKGPA